MRSLRAAVPVLAAALLLLAGCGDDPDPGGPESTWTPSGTPESPTSAATQAPVEPVLPEAATKATEDGARAFIEYYWDLINYAQVTGKVEPLKAHSSRRCDGCNAGMGAVEKLYASGGRIEGGDYTVRVTQAYRIKDDSTDALAYEAKVTARNQEQRIINGDGSVETQTAGRSTIVVVALWIDEAWRLEGMQVR